MKNISKCLIITSMIVLGNKAYASNSYSNAVAANQTLPEYLNNAANAWYSMVPINQNILLVKTNLNDSLTLSENDFNRSLSSLAYNDSAINLFETIKHTDIQFNNLKNPINKNACNYETDKDSNNPKCKNIQIDIFAVGGFSSFDSDYNSEFETDTVGAGFSVLSYLADSFAFYMGYSGTTTKKYGTDTDINATTNSFSVGLKYIMDSGMFANVGGVYGLSNWETDKNLSGSVYDSKYDTSFMSAMMNFGYKMERDNYFFEPSIGGGYIYFKSDNHTDFALQDFNAWDMDRLNGWAELKTGLIFDVGAGFTLSPHILMGVDYEFNQGGDEYIQVDLYNNSQYFIPVEEISGTTIKAGAGIWMKKTGFEMGLDYNLLSIGEFINHTGFAKIRFVF